MMYLPGQNLGRLIAAACGKRKATRREFWIGCLELAVVAAASAGLADRGNRESVEEYRQKVLDRLVAGADVPIAEAIYCHTPYAEEKALTARFQGEYLKIAGDFSTGNPHFAAYTIAVEGREPYKLAGVQEYGAGVSSLMVFRPASFKHPGLTEEYFFHETCHALQHSTGRLLFSDRLDFKMLTSLDFGQMEPKFASLSEMRLVTAIYEFDAYLAEFQKFGFRADTENEIKRHYFNATAITDILLPMAQVPSETKKFLSLVRDELRTAYHKARQ